MIQVINRALDILEMVAGDRSKLYTLNTISSQLHLNKATCANIIKTLVTRGYLEQHGRMTGYRLGPMSYLLTGNYFHKQELLSAANQPMEQLTAKLNEGCILAVLKNNVRVILHEVKSTHELQVVNNLEKEVYRTSTGRMILAGMEKNEQKLFIRKYGLPSSDAWTGPENEEELMRKLQKIKNNQLCLQVSKSQVVGLAIPIYINGKVIAALGVYLPLSRYKSDFQKVIVKELRKAGDIINKNLRG
jgi:DNA-binding IclR family transcriptional regulator